MSGFILADDLSGLLEVAAAFHDRPSRVCSVLHLPRIAESYPEETLALTTETRNSSPAEAAAVVRDALAFARASGRALLFKKIDSTLRGPVGTELAALTEFLPARRILFAPANPSAGRTVSQGLLRVKGVPVAETEFGRDPVSPVRSSRLTELIGPALNPNIVVPDIETQEDLHAIVDEMESSRQPWIGVGSGALARAIAARCGERRKGVSEADVSQIPVSPVLLVCGSAHALNRVQAGKLRLERGIPCHEIALGTPLREATALEEDLLAGTSACALLEARRGDCATASKTIVAAAADVIRRAAVRRLFVTGGETAYGLCRELGVTTLRPITEIEPGLSLSVANSAKGSLLLAIKPGGFGDSDSWIRAFDRLRA